MVKVVVRPNVLLCAACLSGIPVWKWYCKLVDVDSGECALLISFRYVFLFILLM